MINLQTNPQHLC